MSWSFTAHGVDKQATITKFATLQAADPYCPAPLREPLHDAALKLLGAVEAHLGLHYSLSSHGHVNDNGTGGFSVSVAVVSAPRPHDPS